MRIRVLPIAATVLTIAGCQRAHPPLPPRQTILPSSAAPASQRLGIEARWLKQYPDLASRAGDTLVLRYDGAVIATYVDDAKGCDPYTVSKVVMLHDDATDKLQPVAEITCHFGASDNRYLVLPTSDKYRITGDVAASPDGRMLAVSDNALGLTSGQFSLVAWPALTRTASFRAGCRDVVWHDEAHLSALCWANSGTEPQDPDDARDVYFTADIIQDNGQWQMQATGFVSATTFKPVASAARPLPRLTGYVPPPDKP